MEAIIRRAKNPDFKEVLGLNRRMYAEARKDPKFGDYLFFKQPSKQKMQRWFNTLLKDVRSNNAIYYVAELNGHIVGQCFIRRDTPGSELSHVGIFSILVDKNYRNMGIGSSLIESAIKTARDNYEILHLRVFSSNSRAKRLYRRYGFRTFGIAPKFVKRNRVYLDRDYMYLNLR